MPIADGMIACDVAQSCLNKQSLIWLGTEPKSRPWQMRQPSDYASIATARQAGTALPFALLGTLRSRIGWSTLVKLATRFGLHIPVMPGFSLVW